MNIENIKQLIAPILRRHSIVRAGIFGSVAEGRASDDSDIDLLVQLGKKISLLDFISIKHELEDTLGKKVDLVEYSALKSSLKSTILAQEVRIYG